MTYLLPTTYILQSKMDIAPNYLFRYSGPSVFGSERLTGALLDRLTHHVHILDADSDEVGHAFQFEAGH